MVWIVVPSSKKDAINVSFDRQLADGSSGQLELSIFLS